MRSIAALIFLVFHTGLTLAAPDTAIRVGVLPSLSAKVLMTSYQPLRVYLERELQRPVEMSTSTDFKRFQHDTLAGDFDLLVTAPHLARLSQMEAGFLPVATYLAANRAILITAKNKPIKQLDELRGRNLAIFDPLGMLVLQSQQWLEDRGFELGRDYRTTIFPSHSSVGFSVQQGESLMGVISPVGLRQLPLETREQIQVFAELPQVPALIWIVHPRMKQEAARLQAALLRFAETPEGAQFYAGNAYKGMRPVTPEELRSLDRSAREVKRLIQGLP